MVGSVDPSSSEPVNSKAVSPLAKGTEDMHVTINRVKGLALAFGAGHPHSFDDKAQGPRLDHLFHRKVG